MQVTKDVYVPMRDGVELALDIYQPDAPGRYPVVLQRTPYLKSGITGIGGVGADGLPAMSPVGNAATGMVGDSATRYVDAGYIFIVGDARGTGVSDGVYDYYNMDAGAFDGYDTIEWVAAQDWCDGNVGMMGASALGIYCMQAAITQPPHLKAMAPNMFPNDYYHDQWFIGGVFRYENRIGWSTGMLTRMAPQDPGDPQSNNYEKKRETFRSRYDQFYQRMLAGKNATNLDWLTELFGHPTYDDFWKARSFDQRVADVKIPTMMGGVLYDHFSRSTLRIHDDLRVPTRLFMSPGALIPNAADPEGGYAALEVQWFDRFLKGIENGVTEGPAARYYLMGEDRWVDSAVWPIPVRQECLHLDGGGKLRAETPTKAEPDVLVHDPATPNQSPRDVAAQRYENALSFSTDVLGTDLTVIGTPRVRLFALSDAKDVDWIVRLCDVAPDGRAQLLNFGALKASHRESSETPSELEAGKVYEFDIEVWPVMNVFKAGHRVQLLLATSDFPFFAVNPNASTNQILHDEAHPSCLVLPVQG